MKEQSLEEIQKCLLESVEVTDNAYESILNRFDLYPNNDYQKMYYTIGYNGEYDEFLEKVLTLKFFPNIDSSDYKELANEGGDVYWYSTRLTNSFGFKLKEVLHRNPYYRSEVNIKNVLRNVHKTKGKLTESVKKFYRDGKGELTPEWKERIKNCLRDYFEQLQNLGLYYGIERNVMMKYNLLKLIDRKLNNKLHGDGDNR